MRRRIKFFCTDYSSFDSCETEPVDALTKEEIPAVLQKVLKQSGELEVTGRRKKTKKLGVRSKLSEDSSDYYGTSRINGLVGVLRQTVEHNGEKLDCIVEIRSRFDTNRQPWFLWTMLSQVLEAYDELKEQENHVPDNTEDVFTFWTAWQFCCQVRKAYRKGWYRTYVRRETNDSRLIGTIDVARHIRFNAGRDNGNIACTHRERTEQNDLNQLILCAWDYLHSRFPKTMEFLEDEQLHHAYSELRWIFSGERPDFLTSIQKNLRPLYQPYYLEYEALRKTSLMILYDEGVNIFSGTGTEAEGILFYVPDLWEMYLEHWLPQNGEYGRMEMQDAKQCICPSCQKRNVLFIPDYVYYKQENPYYILDAKFRRYTKAQPVLEDLTKLLRDMEAFQVLNGGFILPLKEGETAAVSDLRLFDGSVIHYFAAEIPAAEVSYAEWETMMQTNMNACMQRIGKVLREIGKL